MLWISKTILSKRKQYNLRESYLRLQKKEMSWNAEQVYTLANSKLIEHLVQIDALKLGLFKIDDFRGIRSQWTRQVFVENENHERKEIKHDLPKEGLIVINPTMYRTSYDDKNNDFYECYKEYELTKWDFLKNIAAEPIILSLNLTMEQCKLLTYLRYLNTKFDQPFVYYKCEMWGGQIEEEISIVFDGDMRVYYFDELNGGYKQLIDTELKELEDNTALQIGLASIGLHLPTHFFALHETSFDWCPYRVVR